MYKKYTLKIMDKDLIYFHVSKNNFGQLRVDYFTINNEYKHFLPPKIFEMGILEWIKNRHIPMNRQFVKEIISSLGHVKSDLDIIDVTLALSLTDSYWIVPEDFKGSFKNYNLFDNAFSETISKLAFTGWGDFKVKGMITSPEFTTNGMLRKCWKRIDDDIYLYKGGTYGFANAGLEPYSEYYASQIADRMNISHIKYDIIKYKGIIASTCKIFTSKNISFVPIWMLINNGDIEEIIDVFGKDNFSDMVVFDAVVCNIDRHKGNFGLLRDNNTGEYIGPAPLFDHGMSLFNQAMESDLDNMEEYSRSSLNAFGVDQTEMARLFVDTKQYKSLRKLMGFRFNRHKKYNLDEARLKKIEHFIQLRTKEILN